MSNNTNDLYKIWCDQQLRLNNVIVEPDTICPECGHPWKIGADWGHKICCGCLTCGFSVSIYDKSILLNTDNKKENK